MISRHYRNQYRQLKKQKKQSESTQNGFRNRNSGAYILSPTITTTTAITTTTTKIEQKENQILFTHPLRHVERQTTAHRNAILEPMQPLDRLPEQKTRRTE